VQSIYISCDQKTNVSLYQKVHATKLYIWVGEKIICNPAYKGRCWVSDFCQDVEVESNVFCNANMLFSIIWTKSFQVGLIFAFHKWDCGMTSFNLLYDRKHVSGTRTWFYLYYHLLLRVEQYNRKKQKGGKSNLPGQLVWIEWFQTQPILQNQISPPSAVGVGKPNKLIKHTG
jgi:hypothetical protein